MTPILPPLPGRGRGIRHSVGMQCRAHRGSVTLPGMRVPLRASIGLLAGVVLAGAGCVGKASSTGRVAAAVQQEPTTVLVRFVTALGDFDVAVEVDRAPLTAANFLRYVDAGLYEGGRFHRTVRPDTETRRDVSIEVVQAGIAPEREGDGFAPIPLEPTSRTGLLHVDGAISMARDGPDTATSDFFVCLGDQPSLDFGGARNPDGQGFAAFGRVVRGLDVVRAIQAAPATGQNLDPPVALLTAHRL